MNKEQQIRFAAEELISKGNTEVIHTAFSPDYTAHAGEKSYQGHDFLKSWTQQVQSAIHDIKILKIWFLSENGDTITWQRSMTGVHQKSLRGIPPSSKKVKWTEMVVSRFEEDKIIEEWVVSELAGELMLKQPKS